MTFSGDLAGISLADVFQNLAGNRVTGTLQVTWDRGERLLYIAAGQIAGCTAGPGKDLPLLDHAIERGYVDPTAAAQATTGRRRRKRTARILLEAGLCDAEVLADIWRELTAEAVYELLDLKTARFRFLDGPPAPDLFDPDLLAAQIRLDAGPLLLEGARRCDELQRIRTVIGSDQDLFVAGPQAAEQASDPTAAAIAALLDGRTDIAGLARAVRQSRFAVASALLGLVQAGLARPATGEEIAALAEQALAAGERDDAIRLLGQALQRMPREALLRGRLAETLAGAGRSREAAGELALLAFQAAEDEHWQDALRHYGRAIELDPADVMLHQRRCETLVRAGGKDELRAGLLEWARRLESLGLADRACEVLGAHVDAGSLRGDLALLLRLAELAKANGNLPAAAARWLQTAELHGAPDPKLAERCLRAALRAQPEDAAIQRRLRDLESGRSAHRARRRRQWIGIGIAASVGATFLLAGLCELSASRQLVRILREQPADPTGTATLPALRGLAQQSAWLPSTGLAAAIAAEQSLAVLRRAHELRLAGQGAEAEAALTAALDSLPQPARQRAEALRRQLQHEAPLRTALARIEQRGADDALACQELERATDAGSLPFLQDMLGRARCDAARQHLLVALGDRAEPHAAAGIVQAWLQSRDPAVQHLAERALAAVTAKDATGVRDATEILLRDHREHPEHRAVVEQALRITTSPTATPVR